MEEEKARQRVAVQLYDQKKGHWIEVQKAQQFYTNLHRDENTKHLMSKSDKLQGREAQVLSINPAPPEQKRIRKEEQES